MNSRILIADDEKISARFLEVMINKILKINPDLAFSDTEILAKCAANDYDIILLDINLGNSSRLSGIDVLNQLKQDARFSNTKFIACTAYTSYEDKSKYIELGFSDIVIKPYDVNKLVTDIERIINDSSN